MNLVVVCHLHGLTGKSTVWANGRQNSRLENFLPISSITEKRPRTPETGIKDGFGEMNHEFPFGTFRPEKQDYLFRCSVVPGNFPLERLKKPCFIYFFPAEFCGKRFVNGKQPVILVRNKKTPKDSVASQLFKTSFTDLIGTLWVAKDSCSRNKVTPSCNWPILYKFQLIFTHKKLPQTIKVCMDCRGQTSIFSSKPANDMKVLVKFFHLRKLMIQSNPTLRRTAFKPDISLTRTVWFASWEKSLCIFSKFNLLNTDTP